MCKHDHYLSEYQKMTYITITCSRPKNVNACFFIFQSVSLVVRWYLCRPFFDIQIANDCVYKSTRADSWYSSVEVTNGVARSTLRELFPVQGPVRTKPKFLRLRRCDSQLATYLDKLSKITCILDFFSRSASGLRLMRKRCYPLDTNNHYVRKVTRDPERIRQIGNKLRPRHVFIHLFWLRNGK